MSSFKRKAQSFLSPKKADDNKKLNSQSTPIKINKIEDKRPGTSRTLFQANPTAGNSATSRTCTIQASAQLSESDTKIKKSNDSHGEMDAEQFMSLFKQAFISTMSDEQSKSALRDCMKPLVQETNENIVKLSQVVLDQKSKSTHWRENWKFLNKNPGTKQ